jgi:hypothetical protein
MGKCSNIASIEWLPPVVLEVTREASVRIYVKIFVHCNSLNSLITSSTLNITNFFLRVYTSSLISGFLSKIDHVSLKIKKFETSFLVSKFGKPLKPSKIKFVTKSPLKN